MEKKASIYSDPSAMTSLSSHFAAQAESEFPLCDFTKVDGGFIDSLMGDATEL